MENYQFPLQKVLFDKKPFSRELLQSLLEKVYDASFPFTGYLQFAGVGLPPYFLFFLYGAPFAAGRFTEGKSTSYSIQELGGHLARAPKDSMTISVCETDPVLLKSMLLFLQEEPDVKAPATLLDCDHIVRQVGESGKNAMIALCRDKKINFFYFREGIAALAYYADPLFERPEGMTVDEEMLLYAYQSGEKVQVFIFREMTTVMADDSNLLDKKLLYQLLTVGYLENRRKNDEKISPQTIHSNEQQSEAREVSSLTSMNGIEVLVRAPGQKTKLPSLVLFVVSGPQQGERFTVTLPCTIGRKGCDLILDDRLISRRHAELKMIENRLVIEDLASTNGTKVNGKPVTRKSLDPDDLIYIGPTCLKIFTD